MITPTPLPQPSIRERVSELMAPPQSQSRRKAILTIAKKNNIPKQEAQFRQAVRIVQSQNRRGV